MAASPRIFVFIDTWSNGFKFIEPICKALLKKEQCKLYFLHADSIYNCEASLSKVNIKTQVTVLDISKFGFSFVNAFSQINPDIVVTISMHGIFHRWAVAVAKSLQIKTAFFPHGIRIPSPPKTRKSATTKLQRAAFYFSQFLSFARDLAASDICALWDFCFLMAEFYLSNYTFTNCPKSKIGLSYDTVFLNVDGERKYFSMFMGQRNVVSTTFICAGNVSSTDPLFDINWSEAGPRNTLLFFSQPLYLSGCISISDMVEYIVDIDRASSKLGIQLIVRPHPRDLPSFTRILSEKGIALSINNSFEIDVQSSRYFMGINSASLLGLVELGLPVVILNVPGIALLPDIYWLPYKNAVKARRENLSKALQSLSSLDPESTHRYISTKSKPSELIAKNLYSVVFECT
jgi:hypothetical protein